MHHPLRDVYSHMTLIDNISPHLLPVNLYLLMFDFVFEPGTMWKQKMCLITDLQPSPFKRSVFNPQNETPGIQHRPVKKKSSTEILNYLHDTIVHPHPNMHTKNMLPIQEILLLPYVCVQFLQTQLFFPWYTKVLVNLKFTTISIIICKSGIMSN